MTTFTIYGTPAPQGSMIRTRYGVRPDNPNTKPWRLDVSYEAREAFGPGDPLTGPVRVRAVFVFQRPKGHYRTGRNADQVKDSAPTWHVVKPDADKLARAIGDAVTGIVVRDDSQICCWTIEKLYGEPSRCEVTIEAIG